MRLRILVLFVVVYVCSFSAAAQTVIESESKVAIEDKAIYASIVVESDENLGGLSTRLDLLDTAGLVRAQSVEKVQTVQGGRQTLAFRLPFDDKGLSTSESIAWYRLRYRIGTSSGLISMSELIDGFFELRVIATENIVAGMTYRVRVRAVNPFSGEPVPGVMIESVVDLKVTGNDQKLTLNGTGMTDTDGFAVVDFLIPVETKLDEDGEIRVTGRRNNIVREAMQELRPLKEDVQFLTMTDKPIYQPEQTVNIRGILMKGGEAKVVLPNADVEFTVTDNDDTVLYREKVRSSEFGIASISWRIPANAKLGDYQINIRDENDDQIGGEQIKVSRYDLPNFVVEAKSQKPYYLPGENEAEVEVKADYLFGKPVAKGKVRVVQENSREWNWKEQKYDIDEGQVREGLTDTDGSFTANLDLKEEQDDLKEDNWQKYKDIHFAAYFTDLTTNKTEQRRFDIRITREPIHAYLIGETYGRHPGLPVNFYISTFYADGTPAECDVDIKVSEEDADRFKTYARLKTNQHGAGKFSILRPKIGNPNDDLDFVVIAKDKNGRRGTYKKNISFDDDDDQIQVATDKSIYKPGEAMNVTITSTLQTGTTYVDVVNGWTVIDSRFALLKGGKADLQIPYNDNFKGELKIAAFAEDKNDKIVRASRSTIFPARQGISVEASFDKTLYKPGEDATVNYSILDALGQPLQSALGIVVLDKAVEERARTDESFGGWWRGYSGYLGYGEGFGRFNVKDLNELDLTKPISKEMQLVAEVMFHDSYYYPEIFHSNNYYDEAKAVFSESTKKQFAPINVALKDAYEHENNLHPVDDISLNNILERRGINFPEMRDPWGSRYKTIYSVAANRDIITIVCAGPDKQLETKDDFTVFTAGFEYFAAMGRAIDAAVKQHNVRTNTFIRDEKTLFVELGTRELLDRFGHPYKFIFEAEGRKLIIRVRSSGQNGYFENWGGDDFDIWTNKIDYFDAVESKIAGIQRSLKLAPMSETEFRSSLKAGGVDLDKLRDGFGNPLYITVAQSSRYWDKVAVETFQKFGESTATQRTVNTPVTQQIITFTIRSNGKDGKVGTYDDFTLMQVVHVLAEQTKDDPKPVPVIKPVAYYGASGSIAGVVRDAAGAIVPGVKVIATNDATKVSNSSTTSDNGDYLITNLVAGTYSVKVQAALGFNASTISNVVVAANATTNVNFVLSAGASATVDVSADVSPVDTTSTTVETSITSGTAELLPKGLNFSSILKLKSRETTTENDKSTPRLREYFPETLFWAPEVVTDANGKAEVKFKMADNITTWKMYTVASTKNGRIGVAEKEVAAFQPFFIDLDPPKFLTEGDEIYLPSQVRNYTEKKQSVEVTMAKADGFSFLGPEKQHIDVEAGNSNNSIFGFKATSAVKDGKQRITAVAEMDSDAIEKPVTVRPNGQEIVHTDSRVFAGRTQFEVNFPANALPRTQKAELKIYPNLISHVSESVEGLLKRPYGCGEQTISSTYPNLMILKFITADSPVRRKAKKYLQAGYERLLSYQVADGGFTYWGGKDTSDVALTAYAIRFLNDARSQITVDDDVIKKAEDWLGKQQRADGSWTKKYYYETTEDTKRTKQITTYIARALAMSERADKTALNKALLYLKAHNAEIDEPYAMALFGLALIDAGNSEAAADIGMRLQKMAIEKSGAVYWNLETNTPFYGWGTAGRIETTALALQLLIRVSEKSGSSNPVASDLISKATMFLLRNKDRYGVWYSTQTTINVLDAFLAALSKSAATEDQQIQISANGEVIQNFTIPHDKIDPVNFDLTGKLKAGSNRVEIVGSENSPLMSQIVSGHYIDWRDSQASDRTVNGSRALRLDYKCDRSTATVMEEVTCSVDAERIGFQGYGMLLAEIGTPPGADVSRESLEKAIESDWSISRYDILPDRIIIYMWAKAGGTKFNFRFKPRYAIKAQTPASVIYDYYNPDAQATVAPIKFTVQAK